MEILMLLLFVNVFGVFTSPLLSVSIFGLMPSTHVYRIFNSLYKKAGSVKSNSSGNSNDDDDDLTESESMIGPYVDDDTDDVTENDVMENAIASELSARQGQATGGDKGLLLARLINNLSPETVQEILDDLESKASNIDDNSNEYCPAVMDLSQNCAFADERDIPLDDEARNLCIRHQLCYTCGEALGISPNRCDGGYKGTVLAECRGDVTCVRSAADFLRLMTSQYHVYESYSPDQCLNSCVKDFIYGV